MTISGSDSPTAIRQRLKTLIAIEIRVKIVSNVLSNIFNSTLRLSDIVGLSSKQIIIASMIQIIHCYKVFCKRLNLSFL